MSQRLYLVIGLVALLVLGAGSASLWTQETGNRSAVSPVSTVTGRGGQAKSSVAANPINSSPTVSAEPPATPSGVSIPAGEIVEAVVVTPTLPVPLVTAAPEQPPMQLTQGPVGGPPPTATVNVRPQAVLPTPIPIAPVAPEAAGGPVAVPNNHPGPRWVTLQAGHLRNYDLPDELRHLVPNTGAHAAGVSEVDINEEVAQLTAQYLIERGFEVDLLDATVPVSYTTDLFIAIHADGNPYSYVRGFKAVAPWNSVPASDDFVGFLYEEYGKATGIPSDPMTSVAMANYYAFNPWNYRHAVTPNVPSALLEMGFVTNPLDREILTQQQDRVAWGITNAVDRYFRSGKAGPTPTSYPTFTPSPTLTPTPTDTATPTSTSTSTSTSTPTPTDTPTPVPTEIAVEATQAALLVTPVAPTRTPTIPQPMNTPVPTQTSIPTVTPILGIVTDDGRWLPRLAGNGRSLPPPGSDAPPVLMSADTEYIELRANGREFEQVWQQLYIPELGRSVWRKASLRYVRH